MCECNCSRGEPKGSDLMILDRPDSEALDTTAAERNGRPVRVCCKQDDPLTTDEIGAQLNEAFKGIEHPFRIRFSNWWRGIKKRMFGANSPATSEDKGEECVVEDPEEEPGSC